jgi:hypothetical protein
MQRLFFYATILSLTICVGGVSAHETVLETLIGTPITEPEWSDKFRERLETDLEIARAVMEIAPEREDSHIWLGRRHGYLTRYGEAIDVFSKGLAQAVVAAIPEGLELVENHDYYDGVRFFKSTLSEEELLPRAGHNAKFGVGMVHLFEGRTQKADGILRELVAGSSQGYWPAETELLAPAASR